MNRLMTISAAALAIATTVPAHAEKSDRIMVENMRSRIMATRADLGAERAGLVELVEAEGRLRDLSKALDDNEAADARASVNGIEALIAAARIRANGAARAPQTTPARWSPTVARKPARKQISLAKPARPNCAIRVASR